MLKDTSFTEAKKLFQSFLVRQGLPPDLRWVFREDVISRKGQPLIKPPLSSENERLAELYFEVGRQRDLGICLSAFCLLKSLPCCYIELPEDDLEAQHMLMGNQHLKCSVSTDLKEAIPISNTGLQNKVRKRQSHKPQAGQSTKGHKETQRSNPLA